MARRAQPLAAAPGWAAAALVVALTLGTLAAVALRAEAPGGIGPADWAALRFTLVQAVLSAALSVALAIPVARALARRRFAGRRILITLLGAPFILPVIVAILGLVAVFGRAGPLNAALEAAGLPAVSIYGLQGVVLAHVFFNLPLATRLILQGWVAIPAERFRLAASLGFGPGEVGRFLERPMLREVVPGAFLAIFLICLTSFAVALTLGGGPRATTLELAIYQAFRFDFDLGRAALLSLMQFAICAVAAAAVAWIAVPAAMGAGLDRLAQRWDASGAALRAQDAAVLALAVLFLLTPLGAVVAAGIAGLASLPAMVWHAALTSLAVALAAAGLSVALALGLSMLSLRAGRGLAEGVGALPLAASPLVIGTGLFILVVPWGDPLALALPVTALVNALLSLPFALRAILPAYRAAEADFGRLATSLGMSGAARLRLVILPRIGHALGFAAGLSAALSMGDLGVIALFAAPGEGTLPLAVYRLMAAYRMDEAASAALLLLMLSLALFWAFDRGGRGDAAA